MARHGTERGYERTVASMELFHVNLKPAAERVDEKAASDEAHGPYGRRRLELGGLLGGCLGAA
ncbi:hypothetical protein E4U59_002209 [Claviceps monticola]|nr:hypothetical protein E4U59_002209 [Claviceps monticola]